MKEITVKSQKEFDALPKSFDEYTRILIEGYISVSIVRENSHVEARENSHVDRYVAIEIKKKDLYVWPNPSFAHKIAFRGGKVLYECDRYGERATP